MEQNYGGPVWHASVAFHGRLLIAALATQRVHRALQSVGDAVAGEWFEIGNYGIVHLRRRLTVHEIHLAGDIVMRDIRGTDEASTRLACVPNLPKEYTE